MMLQNSFPYRRIVVIGTTASGKSTLAQKVAERLHVDYIELDALHWEANWQEAAEEDFRARVERAVQRPGWVVDGNYHTVRDLIWPRAEAILWLDYPLPIIFWRLTLRIIRRAALQEELWNGNRENIWWHLKIWSDESLYRWLFKTYWRRKREFPLLFSLPEHQHLHILHFKSPRQSEKWLANLK